MTKPGALMPSSRQRQLTGSNRKNSIKFKSRKTSAEEFNEVQNNSSQKQPQPSVRFFSADNQHRADDGGVAEHQQSSKVIKEKASAKNAKRKLIPSTQQVDNYYTQRGHQQLSGSQ